MALSFKYTPEKLDAWFGLGLSIEQVSSLKNYDVICKANVAGTKLEFGNHEYGIVKDMPIKSGILKMAKEGILPVAAQEEVAKKINGALSICLKQLKKKPLKKTGSVAAVWKDLDQLAAEGEKTGPKIGTISSSEFVEGKVFKEHMASAMLDDVEAEESMEGTAFIKGQVELGNLVDTQFNQSDEVTVFPDKDEIVHGPKVSEVFPTDKDVALKMDKVKLSQATTMYQPVKATSDSSTYHCIGIAGKLKFAARWVSNSNLSIRVEGPVGKHKDPLVAAGFNEDYIQKGYTSVHFNGIEELIAKRALGAVLMGTGLEFETPMPDLGVINGEGT